MIHEDITLSDFREDIRPLLEADGLPGRPGLLVETLPLHLPVELHAEGKVAGTTRRINPGLVYIELLHQIGQQFLVHMGVVVQTDALAPLPLVQGLLDLLQKVGRVVLVDVEVGIPNNPVGIGAYDVIALIELSDISEHDLLKEYEGLPVGLIGRNLNDSRNDRRHLDRGKYGGIAPLAALHEVGNPLLLFQKGSNVQRLIEDQGEGTGSINRHGGDNGIEILFEISVDKGALFLREIVEVRNDPDALLVQKGKQGPVQGLILLVNEVVGLLADGTKLFLGRHTGQVLLGIARVNHILQGSDPDHEEFVQIRGRDGKEGHALHQGILPVLGFV